MNRTAEIEETIDDNFDTGFDSLNEILGGYSIDNSFVVVTSQKENDVKKFLSQTIKALASHDVMMAFASFDSDEDITALSPRINLLQAPIDFFDLRQQVRKLRQEVCVRMLVVNNMTLLNPPEQCKFRDYAGKILFVSHRLKMLALELNIPIIATAPHSALSLKVDDGVCEHGIEWSADVMISLESDGSQFKPIVTKNRYGRISPECC